MSDNNRQEITDFELAQLLRDLPRERQPARDLWQGIERKMLDHPQPKKRDSGQTWMPYAVAASMLVAVSALVLNITQNQTDYMQPVAGIEQMQREYVQVRNPMIEEFDRINQALDEPTRTELYRNFDILAQARRDLEQRVSENPDDRRLVEMLMKVHEQELELLKRDYTKSSRSM